MGTEPTFWGWVGFWVQITIAFYALFVFVGDRVPGLASAATVVRKVSLRLLFLLVDVVGGWGWALIVAVGRALTGLWGALVGPRLAPATAAPVNRFSGPLETYVPLPAKVVHLYASSPASVRPSVPPSAPDQPVSPNIPPAVERLMVDRSREALVDALVAAGWSKTRIREELSGANAAVGAEVDAAIARLEAARAPRQTPLAGRPTSAQFPERKADVA